MEKSVYLCGIVLISVIALTNVEGMQLTECQGVNLTITEDHTMHMNDCLKSIGAKTMYDMDMDKAGCFSKCVFQKKGLIDETGKPHKEKLMNMIDEHLPEKVRTSIKTLMEKCLDDPENKVDIVDCQSFMPIAMCIHASFMEVCL